MDTTKGHSATLTRINTPSWFGEDINTARVDVEFQTDSRLRIKFSDPNKARFEVPGAIASPPSRAPNPLYAVEFVTSPVFAIRVTRRSTGAIVFDTTIGGLILSDQFLQISTRLSSSNMYGLGEHEHTTLRHDMNWKTWAMYARDIAVQGDVNLYGVHPFYMNLESSGNTAHGVLFHNANAQEVKLMPAPALTYRTIGGVLDIYLFFGPTPDNVVQQYNTALGTPIMMPYWSLGFQLSRWGYTDINHMKAAVNRMRQYNIPHDVQYGDIDYMQDKKDFTYDPVKFAGLPQYIEELKAQGTRYVTILDPAIHTENAPGTYPPLDEGNRLNVWVRNSDGTTPLLGEVWPGPTYFPDYSNPSTQTWWTQECVKFINVLDYAGLWIDMNEPANFVDGSATGCAVNNLNNPPYTPDIVDRSLILKTVCADAKQSNGEVFYNVHSLYGWNMARQSLPAARAATGKRSVVFSRSTFPGAGQYSQHWLGDNFSQWPKLHYSMIGTMEFNMFGFPYVGPDICGFIFDTTEELCLRWQQVGAFFPFSRNHNAQGNADQDPGMWPSVGSSTRDTLLIRYTLLPYLYTLFHYAHTTGSSVIRPLFFEFPQDTNAHTVDAQMLWGSGFLISPVTTQGATSVRAYFPNARWYSYYDGAEVSVRQSFIILSASMDFIPLHVRGGNILSTQTPANSTVFSRLNPMGLIVALDDTSQASGTLFWDDGESINTYQNGVYYLAQYTALASGQLTSQILANGYSGVNSLFMSNIRVMGISNTVTSVTVGGATHSSWAYESTTKQLTITSLNLPLTSTFSVAWS